jgi:AbrB family looped-hinge helix DNA binding protein
MKKLIQKSMTDSVKVGSRHQIVIPQKIARHLKIDAGSYMEASEENGAVVFRPQIMVPREDVWFWSPEWQSKEREADADFEAGRVSGPFTTANKLKKELDKLKEQNA